MLIFNQFCKWFLFLFIAYIGITHQAIANERHFPPGTEDVYLPTSPFVRTNVLKNITPIIKKAIADGHYPGAVILVSHQGRIIYRGVFGHRRIVPDLAPMRFDTLFDFASLTKVIATTPSVMQLIEEGKLDLDASVAKYWPEFAQNGKSKVTIRELLTHTSGLPSAISDSFKGKEQALRLVAQSKLVHSPGTTFLYSDVNFITLGYLVELISHESLEQYADKHVFKPLGMKDTLFLPPRTLRDRIAPSEKQNQKLRWGQVHDPITYAMGGVSGAAGVFSDADDLGKYAQYLLNVGHSTTQTPISVDKAILSPLTVLKMTSPQTPKTITDTRGFGWDLDSKYSNRGVFFPIYSFGHSGFTGTSVWIDPVSQTWIIILTSRTHPKPLNQNPLIQDRRMIANIVASSLIDVPIYAYSNTGKGELHRAFTKINVDASFKHAGMTEFLSRIRV